MAFPDWVIRHKKKNTELRFINGNYYLYEVSSKWDKTLKRAKKISGKLLGRITEEGFIESRIRRMEKRPETVSCSLSVKEYGAYAYFKELVRSMEERLRDLFPDIYEEIIVMSFNRLIHNSPLKNMDLNYKNSFISEKYKVNAKTFGSVINKLGERREEIVSFFKSFAVPDEFLLMDLTNIFNYSKAISYSKLGYNNKKEFTPQINLVFLFSSSLTRPLYYRITPGNIREVRSFVLSLEEMGVNDAVLIMDKGFYSKTNIESLNKAKLRYIVPLKRNSSLIDYDIGTKEDYDGYFKFNSRFIWHKRFKDHIVFYDERLKLSEEEDYLDRISNHPENYSVEEFHKLNKSFGTISLYANLEEKAEKIYSYYKSRMNIEQMFDTLKNSLNADITYMRTDKSIEGFMFINFLALSFYYTIYKELNEKNMLSKLSPQDLLKYLSEIKKVKINGIWKTAEISKKTLNILEKFGINIDIT